MPLPACIFRLLIPYIIPSKSPSLYYPYIILIIYIYPYIPLFKGAAVRHSRAYLIMSGRPSVNTSEQRTPDRPSNKPLGFLLFPVQVSFSGHPCCLGALVGIYAMLLIFHAKLTMHSRADDQSFRFARELAEAWGFAKMTGPCLGVPGMRLLVY